MLVFHNSGRSIPDTEGLVPQKNVFDSPKDRSKLFFANSLMYSKHYGLSRNTLFTCFLSIKNPKDTFFSSEKKGLMSFFKKENKDGEFYLELGNLKDKTGEKIKIAVVYNANQVMHMPNSIDYNPSKI